jgi:hypothetical protein
VLPKSPQDLETVHARQHYIEHNEAEIAMQCRIQTAAAFVLTFRGIPFTAKKFFEERTELGVIIDDEDPHGSNVTCTASYRRKEL